MSFDLPREGWSANLVRSWQLAILRFAVTHENADRLAVMTIANEMDRLRRPTEDQQNFCYFRKTSADLCAAIVGQNESGAMILRQYLERLEDTRMKRAFAAAMDMHKPEKPSIKGASKRDVGLWKGLPSRHSAQW